MYKFVITIIIQLIVLMSFGQQLYRVELSKIQNEEQLLSAHLLVLQNKYTAAIEIFEKLLLENPDEGVFAYELSKIYQEGEDNLEKSIQYIDKAIKLEPNNTWYLACAAFLFSSAQDFDKELSINERLIELEPHYVEHYMRTSAIHILNRDYIAAADVINNYESRNGASEWTTLEKHQIYNREGNESKAIAVLEQWLIKHPNSIKFHLILASYHENIGDLSSAKKQYQKILAIDRTNQIANNYLFNDGLVSSKENKLDSNWYRDPTVDVNTKIGHLLGEIKRLKTPDEIDDKKLINHAISLAEAHPMEAKSYAILADLYTLRGQLKEALQSYKKALSLDRNQFLVWENALSLANETGDDKTMLELSEEYLLLFPEKYQSYWFYALANYKAREFSNAIEILEEASLISGNNDAFWSKVTSLLAICQSLEANDSKIGLDLMEKSLIRTPNNSIFTNTQVYLNERFNLKNKISAKESNQWGIISLAQAYHYLNNNSLDQLVNMDDDTKWNGRYYNEYLSILQNAYQKQENKTKVREIENKLLKRGAFIFD